MDDVVLDVRNLCVEFKNENQTTLAVDDISFSLEQGKILGIVGESGSGKSVTSLAIMGLIPLPGRMSRGEIWFRPAKAQQATPVNLLAIHPNNLRHYRGGEIAMIFQEPMSSLNRFIISVFKLPKRSNCTKKILLLSRPRIKQSHFCKKSDYCLLMNNSNNNIFLHLANLAKSISDSKKKRF